MPTPEEFRLDLEEKIRTTPHIDQATDLIALWKTLRDPAWLPKDRDLREFVVHLRMTMVIAAIMDSAPDRLEALERLLPMRLNDTEREQAAALIVLLRPKPTLPSPTHDAPLEVQ